MKFLTTLFLPLFFLTCGAPSDHPATPNYDDVEQTDPYADRIAAAEERLAAGPAGNKVLAAINAHGGLEKWYANSPLYYHFDYRPEPGESGRVRDTYVLNDYVNARAVHQLAIDPDQTFGFDGTDAWSLTGDTVGGMSPRFWSLTPYYFVGLPFVLADEGINFEGLPSTELDGTLYELIKVTYPDGVGDADGDYYVLYLHPESHQIDALRYIVSYPGFFPEGEHSPEKLMVMKGKTEVNGITLPTGYETHWWNDGSPSAKITDIVVSDYEFRPDTPEDAFARPAGARVFNDLPE